MEHGGWIPRGDLAYGVLRKARTEDAVVPANLGFHRGTWFLMVEGVESIVFRALGPVALIALCLGSLCTITAVSLLHQQAAVTRVLRENLASRRAVVELKECLTDLIALENAREAGLDGDGMAWSLQRTLVNELAEHWDQPDNGIWEVRGERRHFTHSRVMVWAAFDRAVRAVERHGLPGPVKRWRRLRDDVHAEVLARGFDDGLGSFVQYFGAQHTDAALLVIPMCGFLPYDDPRVVGTVAAIERELMHDGLLLRYRTEGGVDGLPPGEHPFLACSFWLAHIYAESGRLDEAATLLDRLVALGGPLGLLAEEYDPVGRRMAGNFPQALSHLALVSAVLAYRRGRPADRVGAPT